MLKNISLKIIVIVIFFILIAVPGCTKDVPKEMLNTNKQQQQLPPGHPQEQQIPNDSIHQKMGNSAGGDVDLKQDSVMVTLLTKEADEADAIYQKSKSDNDKKDAIIKQMQAANYLMNQAPSVSQKLKYRMALKRYRRVLELDPTNKEAADNKELIEGIYQEMNREIPKD